MKWVTALRSLAIIYALALPVACWEYWRVHHGQPQADPVRRDLEAVKHLSEVSAKLYPRRRSPHYYEGFRALHQKKYATARRCFEQALAADDKDENLLYEYAETLVLLKERPEVIDKAVAAWRWNFPFSQLPDPRRDRTDSPDYERAVAALQELDLATARRYFELDLAAGSRSEQLLYNYALTLLLLEEKASLIEPVIRQWKHDYPFSERPDPRQAIADSKLKPAPGK